MDDAFALSEGFVVNQRERLCHADQYRVRPPCAENSDAPSADVEAVAHRRAGLRTGDSDGARVAELHQHPIRGDRTATGSVWWFRPLIVHREATWHRSRRGA